MPRINTEPLILFVSGEWSGRHVIGRQTKEHMLSSNAKYSTFIMNDTTCSTQRSLGIANYAHGRFIESQEVSNFEPIDVQLEVGSQFTQNLMHLRLVIVSGAQDQYAL